MVGRLVLDHHGDRVADEGAARLRASDHDRGPLHDAIGWLGALRRENPSWRDFRAHSMGYRAQSMALQLGIDHRNSARARNLHGAVSDLARDHGFECRTRHGLSRKHRALLRALRPSGSDLSLYLRYLRADGAVGDPAARRAGAGAS